MCASYGIEESKETVAALKEIVDASQVTLFESHLCRQVLKKEVSAQIAGCQKYIALFAHVDVAAVPPALWAYVHRITQ